MLLSVCMICTDKSIFFFMDYFYNNDKNRQKNAEKGIAKDYVLTKNRKSCKLIQVALKTILRGIIYGKNYN